MASDLEKKIIKQIEYYFGDFNLSKDKFLQEQISLDDGWVELSVLLSFNRLASLTKEPEIIVNALKKSESGLLVVSDDSKKIRRCPDKPLPEFTEDFKKQFMDRTAYAKGFPQEESLENIMNFLEPHGEIESCIKRTYLDKATKKQVFKGSCFIVFKNVDDCKKFIEAENVKYKDTELIRKWQLDYVAEKREEQQSRRNDKKKKKDHEEKAEEPPITFPKGAILYFTGIPENSVLTREEIKAKVTEVNESEPAHVHYFKTETQGYIRMPNENGAVDFHKKLTDGVLEVGEFKLQMSVLEGEKEKEYLDKTADILSKRRQQHRKKKRNNKVGNRKRKVDDDDNEAVNKKKIKN